MDPATYTFLDLLNDPISPLSSTFWRGCTWSGWTHRMTWWTAYLVSLGPCLPSVRGLGGTLYPCTSSFGCKLGAVNRTFPLVHPAVTGKAGQVHACLTLPALAAFLGWHIPGKRLVYTVYFEVFMIISRLLAAILCYSSCTEMLTVLCMIKAWRLYWIECIEVCKNLNTVCLPRGSSCVH